MQPDPANLAPAEASARPKVLRRPAHFSQKPGLTLPAVEETPKITPLANAPRLPVLAAPAALPWQEDGRFGAWMLAILVLGNLALAVLLAHLLPAEPLQAPEPSLTVRSNATLPAASAPAGASGVTIYSDTPREAE